MLYLKTEHTMFTVIRIGIYKNVQYKYTIPLNSINAVDFISLPRCTRLYKDMVTFSNTPVMV